MIIQTTKEIKNKLIFAYVATVDFANIFIINRKNTIKRSILRKNTKRATEYKRSIKISKKYKRKAVASDTIKMQ